jgi:hypothetical protein
LPDVLKLRVDLPRAALASIIERINAVESRALAAHLDKPGPDCCGLRVQGDTVRHLRHRVRQELVTG